MNNFYIGYINTIAPSLYNVKSLPLSCVGHCLARPDSTLTGSSQWVSGARVLPTFTLLSGHSKNQTPALQLFQPLCTEHACCPKSPTSFSFSPFMKIPFDEVWFCDLSMATKIILYFITDKLYI